MLKGLLYLSVITTFAILLLVGLNVYHNFTTTNMPQITNMENIPITPTFDMETVENIKTRRKIDVDLQESIKITPTSVPTISVNNKNNPSPTLEITQSPDLVNQ